MYKVAIIFSAMGYLLSVATWALGENPTTKPATGPAATIDGTWGYTLQIEDLKIDSVAELKVEGKTVNGSVTSGADTKGLPISDGTLKGQQIEFKVDRISDVGTLRSTYRGKWDGDKIRGTVEIQWVDVPDHAGVTKVNWIATRAKKGEHPPHGIR